MLSKSQEGYTNDMKGLSSSGLNVLTMKSRNNQKKDTKKGQTTISSSKRKSNVLGNTTHTENNVYESAQFKTMKNSLNNLFRTYSTTKDENRTQKKSIDPHKKKSSSPAINNVYSDEKYNKSSSQSNNMSSKRYYMSMYVNVEHI